MAETKTRPTSASVNDYLASRASAEQLRDIKAIMAMYRRVTKQRPRMWGTSFVGFGSYAYTYASGHSGETALGAFAVRGRDLVVYVMVYGAEQEKLLATLGRYKMGKSCLHFRRLADLDATVLEKLVASSIAETLRRHPQPGKRAKT